jgi:hypothetical protein
VGRASRFAAVIAAVAAALAVLVALGRWEGDRHARAENRELAKMRALVGALDQPALDAYRLDVGFRFDCLLYRRGRNPYALELCFDRSGRLVEAIDRRGREPVIASLRDDPSAASIRVPRREVERLLRRVGAPLP